jgi:hypothetical protein
MRSLSAITLLAFLCACPSEVEDTKAAADAGKTATVTKDDKRVVEVGGDLYAKDAPSNPAEAEDGPKPGSGKPDESNGVCRLYAPKLPEPECCAFETGFDVEAAKRICGHTIYLGESIRMSCGYFFSDDTLAKHPSFRASFLEYDTPKQAAEGEAEQLNFQRRKWDIKPEPIEGIEGAYLVKNGRFRWAFLPGWGRVRRLSWITESCADDKITELLKVMVEAKQPESGATRPMIPTARG